jgi:hypothetical protein
VDLQQPLFVRELRVTQGALEREAALFLRAYVLLWKSSSLCQPCAARYGKKDFLAVLHALCKSFHPLYIYILASGIEFCHSFI